jgi:hypothetical protein
MKMDDMALKPLPDGSDKVEEPEMPESGGRTPVVAGSVKPEYVTSEVAGKPGAEAPKWPFDKEYYTGWLLDN